LSSSVTSLEAVVAAGTGDLAASVNSLEVALADEISATNSDVSSIDTRAGLIESSVNSLEVALAGEISATNTDITDLQSSVNSIEEAFVKEPLGNERFAGSSNLESANTAAGALGRTHKAQLADSVEGGEVANVIGVYINGLVADPAYYVLTSDGVTGNSEVTFQTSYLLDTDDTIVVKYIID
jgi:hypothetical protein